MLGPVPLSVQTQCLTFNAEVKLGHTGNYTSCLFELSLEISCYVERTFRKLQRGQCVKEHRPTVSEKLKPLSKSHANEYLGYNPLAPVKPPDACGPGQQLDYNLMRDPEQEKPT